MAWIPVHQGLFTHRKTLHLAVLLKTSPDTTGLHLILLWLWGMDNATPDGDIGEVEAGVLALAAHWPSDAELFKAALITARWLERSPDGSGWRFHDFIFYGGSLLFKREEKRSEMQERRRRTVLGMLQEHGEDRTATSQGGSTAVAEQFFLDRGDRLERLERGEVETKLPLLPAPASWASYLTDHWAPFVTPSWQSEIRADFAGIDLLAEAKQCVDWWAARPGGKPKRPALAFRKWLTKAKSFAATGHSATNNASPRPSPSGLPPGLPSAEETAQALSVRRQELRPRGPQVAEGGSSPQMEMPTAGPGTALPASETTTVVP